MTQPPIPAGFWDRYPGNIRPVATPVPLGNAGGLSGSCFWKAEASAGPIMLRAWPADGSTAERLRQIHAWLGRIPPSIRLASPLADRSGQTVREIAGRSWEVTPFLPGRADMGRPPSRPHLAAMFAAVAEFHGGLASLATQARSPGLVTRYDELSRLIGGELAAMRSAVARAAPSEEQGLASRWLTLAQPGMSRAAAIVREASEGDATLQPVIRDVRPDHFLFEGDGLTGMVDFGAMGVDTIATDIARLLGEAVGNSAEHRQLAFDSYEAVRAISLPDRALIPAFEAANAILGGARWVRWHFREARRFDDPQAVVSGLRRSLIKLAEWDR